MTISSTENAIVRLQEKVDRLEKDITEVKTDVKAIQASVTDISIAIAKGEESMKNTVRYFSIIFTIAMTLLSGVISYLVKVFTP